MSGFLLFGGTATLLIVTIAALAPRLLMAYISKTAGLWIRPGQNFPAVCLFGAGGIDWIEALLVCGAVTPPLLVPALLAAWVTRDYRLKLSKAPDAVRGPRRTLSEELSVPRGSFAPPLHESP